MGLLVQTQFETPEGFLVTSVYLRIATVLLTLRGESAADAILGVEAHVTELARRKNASILRVPNLPTTITAPLTTLDMSQMYSVVKDALQTAGFTSTDVLVNTLLPTTMPEAFLQSSESTQTTPPTLPPPEAPQES